MVLCVKIFMLIFSKRKLKKTKLFFEKKKKIKKITTMFTSYCCLCFFVSTKYQNVGEQHLSFSATNSISRLSERQMRALGDQSLTVSQNKWLLSFPYFWRHEVHHNMPAYSMHYSMPFWNSTVWNVEHFMGSNVSALIK